MIGPKPEKPTAAESRRAHGAVMARAGGLCEVCGLRRATEVHHRLHRSHGGPDTVENQLAVCGWGNHTGCHGRAHSDSLRYVNGWAVRSGYDPGAVWVLYRGRRAYLTADGGVRYGEAA